MIASTTDLTLSRAASIGVVIAVLIPFHTETAVERMPSKMEDTVLFTDSNTDETLLRMPSTTVEIAVLIAFQIVMAVVLIPLKMFEIKVLIAVSTVVTVPFI